MRKQTLLKTIFLGFLILGLMSCSFVKWEVETLKRFDDEWIGSYPYGLMLNENARLIDVHNSMRFRGRRVEEELVKEEVIYNGSIYTGYY